MFYVTSLLHRNNTELILFVDPNKEGLLLVVEDSTTFWPVTLHSCNLEVPVSRHEQEMIVN